MAIGTSVPDGANTIAASRGSGGGSSLPPADVAPSASASCWAAGERVRTCTVAPSANASWAVRWAEAPKP